MARAGGECSWVSPRGTTSPCSDETQTQLKTRVTTTRRLGVGGKWPAADSNGEARGNFKPDHPLPAYPVEPYRYIATNRWMYGLWTLQPRGRWANARNDFLFLVRSVPNFSTKRISSCVSFRATHTFTQSSRCRILCIYLWLGLATIEHGVGRRWLGCVRPRLTSTHNRLCPDAAAAAVAAEKIHYH